MTRSRSPKYVVSRGLALVAVLWIIVILTVIITMAAKSTRLDSRICQGGYQRAQARWACRAGIEHAIDLLNDDLTSSDSLTDNWAPDELEDDYVDDELQSDLELDEYAFTVRIVDEAGKLNINTATRKQLLQLPEMTEQIADAIIDWRDKDDDPQSQGAEAGYYLDIPHGYHIRNGPFATVRELLLVKDVTFELLYGEDTNLNGELDLNECDADASAPYDNADDVLDEGWLAFLTCYSYDKNTDAEGTDRLNINKADEKKLQDTLKLKKSHAKWIVDNRKKSYQSIADLINKDSKKTSSKDDKGDSDKAEPLDLETFADIADKITITDDKQIPGRVNVNTAPREVLLSLLEGNEELAQEIITHRESLLAGMESIAELLKVKRMTVDAFKKIANSITTRANVFSVTSRASSTRSVVVSRIEAVIDRTPPRPAVLYWYQGADS